MKLGRRTPTASVVARARGASRVPTAARVHERPRSTVRGATRILGTAVRTTPATTREAVILETQRPTTALAEPAFAGEALPALVIPAPARATRASLYAEQTTQNAEVAEAATRGVRPKADAATVRRRLATTEGATVPPSPGASGLAARLRRQAAAGATTVPAAVRTAVAIGRVPATVRAITTAIPHVEGVPLPRAPATEG